MNMLEALERTAARAGERVAFESDEERMTYAQLKRTAQAIGTHLARTARPRSAVALLLDARSIRNIPALYGALYAGCAYAPLDIAMPPERLGLLLGLLAPEAILADERGEAAVASLELPAPLVRYADAAAAQPDENALAAIRAGSRDSDPMSILYTSGSTGIPKGSVQTHASYARWTHATIAMYGFDEDTVFGNQSPFFYANSIIDIFPPVALGARVYLLPSGALTFPRRMLERLNAHRVTELTMTPSSFVSIVNAGVLEPGCLPHLRWGIMSGESMPWQPLHAFMEATPAAAWWHFYGSTEMFSVAVGRVEGEPPAGERLPVGRPFGEVRLLFVDENGAQAPVGTPGEMLVASPWVAEGYHRDAERTDDAWIVDPLGLGEATRYYRSGDVGVLRADGQLMVLGRRDAQIKHMGYRMELGEVEAALRAVPGCQDGCVLYERESDRLWCFYTGALTEEALTAQLKRRLARYMLPDVLMHMDALPYTPSMKLNRAALAARMREEA